MYCIYQITNKINGKRYISQHKYEDESKKKISEANKGMRKPSRSEEHRRKLSKANKGKQRSDETKKRISDAKKGRHWYTNGVDSVLTFECPIGYKLGRVL